MFTISPDDFGQLVRDLADRIGMPASLIENEVTRFLQEQLGIQVDDDLTLIRLEEIRARAEAATPGPWTDVLRQDGSWCVESDHPNWPFVTAEIPGWNENTEPDAVFVAHAREDIPWLLAALGRVEQRLTVLERIAEAARRGG